LVKKPAERHWVERLPEERRETALDALGALR
jgi:hypothetical protein